MIYDDAVGWLIKNRIFSPTEVERVVDKRFPSLDKTEVRKGLGLRLFELELSKQSLALLMNVELASDPLCLYVSACIQFSSENYLESRSLFIKSLEHEHGLTRAYHWLGYIYQNGLGVETDIERSLEYYKKGENCGYIYPKLRRLQLSHYSHSKTTFYDQFRYFAELVPLLITTGFLLLMNRDDERLADIPGVAELRN